MDGEAIATRGVDWNTPGNAERYERYTERHPLYQITSRDLIMLADLGAARTIVDLCCGTGVTTEAALEAAPRARVIAVDASSRQLEIARRRIGDARVTFVEGLAEQAAALIPAPVDSVVCNAAVWQLKPEVLPAIASLLGPGGRFAFNFPAPFVPAAARATAAAQGAGLPPTRREGSIERAMLDEARRLFGYTPPARGGVRRGGAGFEHGFFGALAENGLRVAQRTLLSVPISPEAALDWYLVPVFRTNVLPGMSSADSEAVLLGAYAGWRSTAKDTSAIWLECLAVKDGA